MTSSFLRTLKLGLTAGSLAASCGAAFGACGPDTTISPTTDYTLTFRVCGSALVGTVQAIGTGWVAVGFSGDQYMPQTDVFMAGVLPDGTVYSNDAFAFFRSPPVRDAQQDVSLLAITELNGVTTYTFSRPLKTGDGAGDYDLTSGPFYILGAFNRTSDSLTDRHTNADASDFAYQFAPVPEPASWAMLAGGLGLLAAARRERR